MKVTTLLAAGLTALAGGASAKFYTPVWLQPPYNWVPDRNVWPSRILEGFSHDYRPYSTYTWTEYVKAHCDRSPGCTSIVLYSAVPGSPPGERRWYGYLIGGAELTPKDFLRSRDPARSIRDAKAFHAYGYPPGLNETAPDGGQNPNVTAGGPEPAGGPNPNMAG